MKLVIAVSHVDFVAALRQMGWIGFLSEQDDNSMLNESVLLVVSRRASRHPRFKLLAWLAARVFGEARILVPDQEHEVGWPGSANWMFKQVLEHVEKVFPGEPIFFLEPDGTPVTPDWFRTIKSEWPAALAAGKSFMGAYVPHTPSHMTGIAVYGPDWRKVAPRLITCPDHDAWDTWSAPEVVPNCHFVRLIQHVFRRHDPGWLPPAVGILDKAAVLFHQDKHGKLVELLDNAYFGGRCAQHPLFSYSAFNSGDKVMMKFYYAANATKAIVANGKRFVFNPLDAFGGAIPGEFSTDSENDQAALAAVTSDPTTGVIELSQQEWEDVTKKKAPPVPEKNTSQPLNSGLPQVAILPTPSQSPAVVVGTNSSVVSDKPGAPVKDIKDLVKTGTVKPSQADALGKLPRPGKAAK